MLIKTGSQLEDLVVLDQWWINGGAGTTGQTLVASNAGGGLSDLEVKKFWRRNIGGSGKIWLRWIIFTGGGDGGDHFALKWNLWICHSWWWRWMYYNISHRIWRIWWLWWWRCCNEVGGAQIF